MGVDAKTRQRQLWDILGRPEKKQFAFDPILTGKRIGAGRGEYWYGNGGNGIGGADDGKGDDNKDKDEQDGKNSGGNQSNNGGDPRRDPSKGCPKPGDSVPGLKNMRDCATGRCVNVNFTLPAPAPQGWDSVCQPPQIQQTPYFLASNTKYNEKGASYPPEYTEKTFLSRDAAVAWLKTVIPEHEWPALEKGWYSQKPYSDNGSGGYYAIQEINKYHPLWQPTVPAKWPQEVCAEIVSTATGFAPACEEHDPNLPPQLKGDNSAIRLCDANGNEITIRRNGKGWVYETATCTATVNDGGVVDNVRDKP